MLCKLRASDANVRCRAEDGVGDKEGREDPRRIPGVSPTGFPLSRLINQKGDLEVEETSKASLLLLCGQDELE